MAKRILVPLDEAAETQGAVESVGALARSTGASVRLLHVAPLPRSLSDERGHVLVYADQESARLEAEGLDYLAAAAVGLDGVAVENSVRFGDPAQQILKEAEAWNADLIVMATRDGHCIGWPLFGSVAEQVFRKAPMAVFVYRAPRVRQS